MNSTSFRTRAAFHIGTSGWQWVTWTHRHGSKHAAIVEKAKEIGASAWDMGNADHAESSRAGF